MKYLLYFLLLWVIFSFFDKKENLFFVPKDWPKPVYNFKNNPLSKEKVFLGRNLFYDPILSRDNSISCASCHSPFNAFTHVDHNVSHGIEDRIGTRNSPTLMNLAWHGTFMWDGAINHLDMQALAPISHFDEMDEEIDHVIQKLNQSVKYKSLFFDAFGDSLVTGEKTLKAISQFMLTLISAHSKYDLVKQHKAKFTHQEKNGYKLFQNHCASCHQEPLFTNLQFENNGLKVDSKLNDIGRMRISHQPSDSLKFKVPTLRNIEFSYPYMHDGRFKKLNQVLQHYTIEIQNSATLSTILKKPIQLTSNEKVDIISFLLTLSDKEFLFNPSHGYPK